MSDYKLERTESKGTEREVLLIALKAGKIMLENGAEIFRVEDTVSHICDYYGLKSANSFVLSNGIFLTAGDEEEPQFAKVQQIPVNNANLSRVAEVNQLSRQIEQGCYTLEDVRKELHRIEHMPGYSPKIQILTAGIAGSCFTFMTGGSWQDMVCSLFIGILFYTYFIYIGKPYLSKIVRNITGSSLITMLCIFMYLMVPGTRPESMIIGGIILMVPGMAFTNGIRDMGNGDYISGSVRMLDAGLVFLCIALGVGFVIALYNGLTGGVLL